jgi:hypothetical protein
MHSTDRGGDSGLRATQFCSSAMWAVAVSVAGAGEPWGRPGLTGDDKSCIDMKKGCAFRQRPSVDSCSAAKRPEQKSGF